ncbi:hypothetical protein TNCV_3135871 [Trichonephila clavipes]|nr:hypothetical protein TNCV_3135871 [Trichonephila clavipes]
MDERFHPSEVRWKGNRKRTIYLRSWKGKEFNVYRNSDCEVKMKVGLCEESKLLAGCTADRSTVKKKEIRSLDIIKHWNAKRSSVPYLEYWALDVDLPAFDIVHPDCLCHFNLSHRILDEVAEWLRRWTANPLDSARVVSNPILVGRSFLTNV